MPRANLSFLVYRLDFTPTNTQVRMYINPTLSSEPASATVAGSADWFQFNKVRIVERQNNHPNAGQIDELRIGGTWASVAPALPRTDAPTITQDLAGISSFVYAGGVVTMTIVAEGAPPHYQWKKNGTTPVGTDSPTLSLTSVTLSDTGDYSVMVTNAAGSATSGTNHVTVVTSPDPLTTQMAMDGPMAFWPLNESVASTAYDYSSRGNDGTQNGNLTLGAVGPRPPTYAGFSASKTAYQFDGGSFVDCGTGPALSGTTDFTLEAWINTTSTAIGYILQQRSSASTAGEYMFFANADGTLHFSVYNGSYQFDLSTPVAGKLVNDGQWHHVVAVRSGATGVIYIDGTTAATASGPVKSLNPALTVGIGGDLRDNISYFSGLMCDAAIYSTALSAATVQTHYSVAKNGAVAPQFNPPVLSNGQLTISWTGTGTLLGSTNVVLPMSQWTTVTSASPYVVTPATAGPRMYYRLRQ
ncbi:MAG: LamG domain-containing protein [Verrucomicrobia bacterium]|nr:LamG domain-containing protein [Verrucomicrobiota bacterium]